MASHFRSSTPKTYFWRRLAFRFSLIGSAVVLSASACQTSKKSAQPTPAPVVKADGPPVLPRLPETMPGVMQITQIGENSQARFSPDGRRLIFISRLRTAHKQAQVYELMLPSLTERRLTFHDGDDLEPSITPDGQSFYYASGTDELKEEAVATERLMRNYYPEGLRKPHGVGGKTESGSDGTELLTEIYLQNFDGRSIERLTNDSGYDGDLDIEPTKGKQSVFTSNRDGAPAVYIADQMARGARRLSEKDQSERGARFSRDGKTLLWTRLLDGGRQSKLMTADGNFRSPRVILDGAIGNGFVVIHPTWHPNGTDIIFSSNRDGQVFRLYSIDREGRCLKRISTLEFDQLQPAVTPDGQRIVFTGRHGETTQLFAMDYRPNAACLPTVTAATPTAPPVGTATPEATSSPVPSPTPPTSPTPSAPDPSLPRKPDSLPPVQ